MTTFKGIHTVSIKLNYTKNGPHQVDAMKAIESLINDPSKFHSIDVNNGADSVFGIKKLLADKYGDLVTWRDGVTNGCYGSSTGGVTDGITVSIDATLFPERWDTITDDGEHDEWHNPLLSMKNAGWKRLNLDEDQVESFIEELESMGCEVKHDNTYNQSGMSETVVPLYDFDFKVIEQDSVWFVAVMFHHGGDPRGNYGARHLFVCNGMDSFYEAVMPSWYGEEDPAA